MNKQDQYAIMKVQLKKAMRSKFYFEAIFIEYAIIEDRAESVLNHAGGIKLTDCRGNPLKLQNKLNKIRDNSHFQDSFIRKRITPELVERIREWKDKRNNLVHNLMNGSSDFIELEKIAVEGSDLVRIFDNKVKSVNNYFSRICIDGE